MHYLQAFLVGGVICLIGQLLINYTNMTSARILVTFLMAGIILEAVGVYKYILDIGLCGASVPISGFGALLARGAINGAAESGIIGAVTEGMIVAAGGLTSAIVFGFIFALVCKARTKS